MGLAVLLRLSFLAARFSLSVLPGFLPLALWGDLSAMVDPVVVVGDAVRVDADEEVEQLADGALLGDRVAQRQVLLDAVPVATAVLVLDHVAGVDEIGDDAVGAALGDAHDGGEVPQAHARVMGDAQQRPSMVGEQAPTAHAHTLPEIPEFYCMFLVSWIGWVMHRGGGRLRRSPPRGQEGTDHANLPRPSDHRHRGLRPLPLHADTVRPLTSADYRPGATSSASPDLTSSHMSPVPLRAPPS